MTFHLELFISHEYCNYIVNMINIIFTVMVYQKLENIIQNFIYENGSVGKINNALSTDAMIDPFFANIP